MNGLGRRRYHHGRVKGFNTPFQTRIKICIENNEQKVLTKTVVLLGIILVKFHCAETQAQKTEAFNPQAFQQVQVPQEHENSPKTSLFYRGSGVHQTSTPNIQTSPREIYAQGDTTYVSGSTDFSYKPDSQAVHSDTFSDVRKASLSFAQNVQGQQYDSTEDSSLSQVENLEESVKNLPESSYQKTQAQVNFAGNDNWNDRVVYSSGKGPHENVTVAQQKNAAHDSDLRFGNVQSKRMRKVPVVLITIQKGQNGLPKERANSNSKIKDKGLDNSYKYNNNQTNLQEDNFRYYTPVQIDVSKEQTVFSNKFSLTNQAPNPPVASKKVIYRNPATDGNTLQYSIPQAGHYSRTREWKPMDRSKIQHFESKAIVPNYKQEQYNPEFSTYTKSSHENQQNSQLHGNHEPPLHVHSRSKHLPLQQSNRYHSFGTKSGIDSDFGNESSIKSYGDTHINEGQQVQTSHIQPEGHAYQQNHSSNSITSILHRQLTFQNVTFPTNKENHSHTLPHSSSETFLQTDTYHTTPHSNNVRKPSEADKIISYVNQNLNQEIRMQNQNYDYFVPNNDKNVMDSSRTHPSPNQQMKIDQFHVVNNDGRTSRTEMVNNFQVTPMPELRPNSPNGYQEMFTTKGQEVMPSNSGEYGHSPNQNVQEEQNEKFLFRMPTNKNIFQNSGYVIFPLDDKYTVQNNGNSGRGYNIVLDKLNSAYDPVKKLFMYQNTDPSEENSRNFFRSSNEETGNKAPQRDDVSNSKKEEISYINSDYSASKNNPSADIRTSNLPEGNSHFSSAFDSYNSRPENLYPTYNHANSNSGKPENINHNEGMIRPVNFGMFHQHAGMSRESSEEQTDTFVNLPIQYASNYDLPIKYTNGETHETPVELQDGKNAENERNIRQFQSSHPEYMNHNSNGDTNKHSFKFTKENQNEHSLKFMKENQNSESISPTHVEKPHKSYGNSRVEVINQYKNGNIKSTEFQVSSAETSNLKRDFNKHKNSHHRSKSSSPKALVLVLVSEKDSNLNDNSNTEDITSEYAFDSSSKDISELLGQESNAKKLLETLYNSSSRNIKQKKPDYSNKGTSSKHGKN
ncbi:hypothetical protein AVEN_100532-1 [Araneus ventricosus]|uniref:Uncharacterized protein n=1 Tax=Araneus ventricosus TaxID=182803 RepID=A0A4Y2IU00_ARAVE|nr:hypothetical protein AVEN_100532-1 [Araneus ventricosus]